MVGYRKLTVAALFLITAVVMRVLDYVPGEGWMDSMSTAMTAFFGANLVERALNFVKDKTNG